MSDFKAKIYPIRFRWSSAPEPAGGEGLPRSPDLQLDLRGHTSKDREGRERERELRGGDSIGARSSPLYFVLRTYASGLILATGSLSDFRRSPSKISFQRVTVHVAARASVTKVMFYYRYLLIYCGGQISNCCSPVLVICIASKCFIVNDG